MIAEIVARALVGFFCPPKIGGDYIVGRDANEQLEVFSQITDFVKE